MVKTNKYFPDFSIMLFSLFNRNNKDFYCSIPSWNIDLIDQLRSTLQSAVWLKWNKSPLILPSCWFCLKIKRLRVYLMNHIVILWSMVFTTKQLEKDAEPHIWCEYPFKDFQILLFVYIIEGAASDRGAHGLCHCRENLSFCSGLFLLRGLFLIRLYNPGSFS